MFKKRSAIDKKDASNRRKAERQRLLMRIEAETLQLLFAVVAEADGKLTDAEAATYSSFIAECSTYDVAGAERIEPPVAWTPGGDLVGPLRRYMNGCRPTLASRRKLLRALRQLAACDGALNEDESLALDEVARLLQIAKTRETARSRTNRFAAQANGGAERGDRSTAGNRSKASKIGADKPADAFWCYAVLGCYQHDSDDVVKRAYRRLASLLHPDKYSARAASPQQILIHQQEFQRLQEAYEEVKRLRAAGRQRRGSR